MPGRDSRPETEGDSGAIGHVVVSRLKLAPVLLALALLGVGCKDVSTSDSVAPVAKGAGAASALAGSPSSVGSPASSAASAKATPVAAHPPAPARTGELLMAGGVVLPNHTLTPGATNPAVTQATIHATICLTGYTKTVRPSSTYTTALKRRQLAAGYTYRGDLDTSDYEEDHLISLELGGSPASVKNLWPEPYAATEGARVKDKIENELHDLVCSGRLSLRTAQRLIATNWWSAFQAYGGAGVPRVWDGAYGVATSGSTSTTSGTSSSSTSTATAQCRDGSLGSSKGQPS